MPSSHGRCHFEKAAVAGESVRTQHLERVVYVDSKMLDDHTLGLLHGDAASKSVIQAAVTVVGLLVGVALHDGDSGYVGEPLGERDIAGREGFGVGFEQVEAAEGDTVVVEGECIDPAIPVVDAGGSEFRPGCRSGQVGSGDGFAGGVAVQTRTLFVLKLEQFEQSDLFAGRAANAEVAGCVGEEDARFLDVQKINTYRGQLGEYVDDIEVVDEGVEDLDEGVRCAGVLCG